MYFTHRIASWCWCWRWHLYFSVYIYIVLNTAMILTPHCSLLSARHLMWTRTIGKQTRALAILNTETSARYLHWDQHYISTLRPALGIYTVYIYSSPATAWVRGSQSQAADVVVDSLCISSDFSLDGPGVNSNLHWMCVVRDQTEMPSAGHNFTKYSKVSTSD